MSLDLSKLVAEAHKRYDNMSANPDYHGSPDLTFSKFVIDQADKLSVDLINDATNRLGTEPVVNYLEKDKKRLLASKLVAGEYDA